MIVIDNRRMHEEAKKAYRNFQLVYDVVKRHEREKRKIGSGTMLFIKMCCREVFKIHPELREGLPELSGLNCKLKEMVERGFLELKDEEICPFDPVTKDIYTHNLFRRYLHN